MIVIQFCNILLLNAWRGLKHANYLPALGLLFVSASVLLVGSHAAASRYAVERTQRLITTLVTPTTPDASITLPISSIIPRHQAARSKVVRHAPKVASVVPKPMPTPQSTNNSAVNQNQAATVTQSLTGAVVLNQTVPSCQQGVQTFTVSSASVNLSSPTITTGNLTWYWESLYSGTNTSDQPPVSNVQTTQTIDTGTSQVTITATDPSQPLLTTQTNANNAFSFRLHVLIGSSDFTSDWVSVPQVTGTTCP